MPGQLKSHCYGKHQVRVSKVSRSRQAEPIGAQNEFAEATVDIELEGDFDAAFTAGDNRAVIATDTCKNTVYALAKDHSLESVETFGLAIAKYFADQFPPVDRCHVALSERVWARLLDSPHSFISNQRMTPTATISLARGAQPVVRAGVQHLLIAKTSESGFRDFHQSEFRTLADTDDRILATELSASWTYDTAEIDFATNRKVILGALLARFVDHYSHSVQETLYLMGQAAIDACSAVAEITLNMPNKHHLLADLSPFGLENENEVFVVTDEPFGYIRATLGRR